jgi:fructan beta-fructosidase
LTKGKESDITIIVDKMSVEVFADGGRTTMTAIYFPSKDFSELHIVAPDKVTISNIAVIGLESIWKH